MQKRTWRRRAQAERSRATHQKPCTHQPAPTNACRSASDCRVGPPVFCPRAPLPAGLAAARRAAAALSAMSTPAASWFMRAMQASTPLGLPRPTALPRRSLPCAPRRPDGAAAQHRLLRRGALPHAGSALTGARLGICVSPPDSLRASPRSASRSSCGPAPSAPWVRARPPAAARASFAALLTPHAAPVRPALAPAVAQACCCPSSCRPFASC